MKRHSLGKFLYLLNKWNYGISIGGDLMRGRGITFSLWFFKLKSFPEHGEMLQPKHYTGFNFGLGWNIEIDIYRTN